jgi:hypothetical protein
MKLNALKTVMTRIEEIFPYENNPRLNAKAISKVAASIKEFGFLQPIVTDAKGVIIVGHTRFEGAKQLGMAEVPVHIAVGLTEDQVRAYRINDNRSGEVATWDEEFLKLELSELKGENFNVQLTGYALQDIDLILADVEAQPSYADSDSAVGSPHREARQQDSIPESVSIVGYDVLISPEEFKRAIERIESYVEEHGLIHGFVAHLLGITSEESPA